MKHVLVVGYSVQQFERWMQNKINELRESVPRDRIRFSRRDSTCIVDDLKYTYITSGDHMRGYRGDVVFLEDWMKNRSREEIDYIHEITARLRLPRL